MSFDLDRVPNGYLRDLGAMIDALDGGNRMATHACREIGFLADELTNADWLRLLMLARSFALISAATRMGVRAEAPE